MRIVRGIILKLSRIVRMYYKEAQLLTQNTSIHEGENSGNLFLLFFTFRNEEAAPPALLCLDLYAEFQ